MTTFSVNGTATMRHEPEEATLRVAAVATGQDPAALAELVADAHASLEADLADVAEGGHATPTWSSGSVSTSTYREYPPGDVEPRLMSRVRLPVELLFTDFGPLGLLVRRWAAHPALEIDGLDWLLRDETRRALARQARLEAVQDATARAADYAASLGLGSPVLDRLFEEGLRPGGAGGGGFARDAMMMKSAPHDGVSFDLTPPTIEVAVSISADFTA
jgi:hypothetical protein